MLKIARNDAGSEENSLWETPIKVSIRSNKQAASFKVCFRLFHMLYLYLQLDEDSHQFIYIIKKCMLYKVFI